MAESPPVHYQQKVIDMLSLADISISRRIAQVTASRTIGGWI